MMQILLEWFGSDWFCLLQKNGLDDLQKSLPALYVCSYRPQPLLYSSVTQLTFLKPCEHVKLPNILYELFTNRSHILSFSQVTQRPDQILFFYQSQGQTDLLTFCIYLLMTLFICLFVCFPPHLQSTPYCKCVSLSSGQSASLTLIEQEFFMPPLFSYSIRFLVASHYKWSRQYGTKIAPITAVIISCKM